MKRTNTKVPVMGDCNSGDSKSPSVASPATSSGSPSQLAATEYAHQAERLSHLHSEPDGTNAGATAVRADWVTPQDAIIVTADGGRLPTVPPAEAARLDDLREKLDIDGEKAIEQTHDTKMKTQRLGDSVHGGEHLHTSPGPNEIPMQRSGEGSLRRSQAPSRTNPLFPPLPLYGPPSKLRDIQCMFFRITSFFLSLAFLAVIVLGSIFTSLPSMFYYLWLYMTCRDPNRLRPFHQEEQRRKLARAAAEKAWLRKTGKRRREPNVVFDDTEDQAGENNGYTPTAGGPDPIVCDVGYYARRVGLEVEEFKVQTEDGFIIRLWHVYNPRDYTPLSDSERDIRGPDVFTGAGPSRSRPPNSGKPKYPVLLMHGLLQSAGAYCTNDDDSFAFYLCKQGYDVWLGNNRCGFQSEHTLLNYGDPRMWAWNIRQMGVMDLPALISRILSETGFEKLGLICHSQGTTETFVALAKEQRPDLGHKISVFCALAPAAYAGPLIGKMYFKFMRVISPGLFRIIFGIHAFIPIMMTMHSILPGKLYGYMGYRVFSFLFNWTDTRWDRALRNRMFQFAPVYVSAESMRWWLGRECFAKQKCILTTREETKQEEMEDQMEETHDNTKVVSEKFAQAIKTHDGNVPENTVRKAEDDIGTEKPKHMEPSRHNKSGIQMQEAPSHHEKRPHGSTAWYDNQCPPFALWVCGSDNLVDGQRLLRRFERGREPHVKVVHSKVINEYEHLDVIWAIDAVEKVGKEIKEVVWKTAGEARKRCKVPLGCEDVARWRLDGDIACRDSSRAEPTDANETCYDSESSSSDE